jgi:hypothetical protein
LHGQGPKSKVKLRRFDCLPTTFKHKGLAKKVQPRTHGVMPCTVWQHKACTRAFCLLYSANHGRCIYVMSIDSAVNQTCTVMHPTALYPLLPTRVNSITCACPLTYSSALLLTVTRRPVAAPRIPNISSCCNHNPARTAGSESEPEPEPYSYCRYSTLQYRSNKPGGNTASMTPSLIQSRTGLRYRGAFGAQLAALVNCRELVHCWVSCYPVVIAVCSTKPNAPDQGQTPMPTCLHESSSTGIYPAHETRVDQSCHYSVNPKTTKIISVCPVEHLLPSAPPASPPRAGDVPCSFATSLGPLHPRTAWTCWQFAHGNAQTL